MNFFQNSHYGKIELRLVMILTLLGSVISLGEVKPAAVTKSSQKKDSTTSKATTSSSSKTKTNATTTTSTKKSTNASSKKASSHSKKKKTPKIRGQQSLEASRITEIQNALSAAGYYKSAPTGKWDDETSKAISDYQQKNGFKVTGKPDALSLKKLGL
jgi:peptidoglycan hydrolase-like protein with peptidoglycan-binding domain